VSRKIWLPSSAAFTLGLIVLGALPAIKPPFAALAVVSLDTKLGTGLYLAVLAILGGGFLLSARRENNLRKTDQQTRDDLWRSEQDARDTISKERHIAELAATATLGVEMRANLERESAKWLAATQERDSLLGKGASPQSPKILELSNTVRISASTMEGIVSLPADGIFKLSGYSPIVKITADSKAPLFPSVSSKDKPSS
jgi:hypothetical protein